jgi:hypothetical protein
MLEDGSGARIDVMPAPLAGVSAAACNAVKLGSNCAASRTYGIIAEAPLHDGIKAGVIIRIL